MSRSHDHFRGPARDLRDQLASRFFPNRTVRRQEDALFACFDVPGDLPADAARDIARETQALLADVPKHLDDERKARIWEDIMMNMHQASSPLIHRTTATRGLRMGAYPDLPNRLPRLSRLPKMAPVLSAALIVMLLVTIVAGMRAFTNSETPSQLPARVQLAASSGSATPETMSGILPTPTANDCKAPARSRDAVRSSDGAQPSAAFRMTGKPDNQTALAVVEAYREINACQMFNEDARAESLMTDRYLRLQWAAAHSHPVGPGGNSAAADPYAAMGSILPMFITPYSTVKPELASYPLWSSPSPWGPFIVDPAGLPVVPLRPSDLFTLTDGRVGALIVAPESPQSPITSTTKLPTGFYGIVVFAQQDGKWLLDESVLFGIGT